ncbi:hypothetical protein LRY65_03690 [Candidatus Woesebacteria bacterium]|nr:hypothetical protein [Candidatus Woesebacteria bacterium]MCD8506996.1 hypothetical protein [Candidatus Woesebacteria bacterium]MCD8527285.1 hypothetical protein [Candidatus Woesebacteria bacterium]MCD8546652.1 hypothetical protein [Candidatus Woesebacteria bacterium]
MSRNGEDGRKNYDNDPESSPKLIAFTEVFEGKFLGLTAEQVREITHFFQGQPSQHIWRAEKTSLGDETLGRITNGDYKGKEVTLNVAAQDHPKTPTMTLTIIDENSRRDLETIAFNVDSRVYCAYMSARGELVVTLMYTNASGLQQDIVLTLTRSL